MNLSMPAAAFVICVNGDPVVTIETDGSVVIGKGLKPDEAGRLAAESLARTFPTIVAAAVAEEREACARILEIGFPDSPPEFRDAAFNYAAAIRARTKGETE